MSEKPSRTRPRAVSVALEGPAISPSELARLTGVSTDTLRHYERKGVLGMPARSQGGYRLYPPEAVGHVRLARRALAIGFTLHDLATTSLGIAWSSVGSSGIKLACCSSLACSGERRTNAAPSRNRQGRITPRWSRRCRRPSERGSSRTLSATNAVLFTEVVSRKLQVLVRT
jgi:hypothetical protein